VAERAAQTVLVVDDEDANRYVISRHLRSAGYEVLEACDGREALAQVGNLPDLVILDVKLPDINGREVCRLIKSSPETQNIIVVHVSAAFVAAEDRILGLECGADGYLTYPLNPSELVANIRALLRIRDAEARATVAARQLETTFRAINDGVCLLDADGKILRCNPALATLIGRPEKDLAGEPFYDVVRQSLGLVDLPPLSQTAFQGARRAMELNSGDRWYRVAVDPVWDTFGRLTGAVHVLTDITARKHLDAKLQRQAEELASANRAKDEFLAMLGHELRNPLAPILNAVGVLRAQGSEEAVLTRSRDAIERQVHHMARLVDDLLDVSRITRGTIELRQGTMDLTQLVRQVAQSTRPLIESHAHTFHVSVPAEPLWLRADATRLEQVLANLLTNAVKYTPDGGEIWLTCGCEGDEAVVRVRDSGRGIPPEMLPRIFELFTQVSPSIDRAQGGLGLGLTLVRRLVEMHGGHVTAHSTGLGHGAEFMVRLPLAESYVPHAEVAGSTPGGDPPAAKRILIVEDNADSRETLRDLLELWGHEVDVAPDGTAGLVAFALRPPDVALIDIGLPGLNGYDLTRQIRANGGSVGVRLVALTGYGQPEDRRRALEAGFDDHLVKPLDPEKLRHLLSDA
jgi:PAS domain S-box-containing protein